MSEGKRFCRFDQDSEMYRNWANSPLFVSVVWFNTRAGLGGVVCFPHNESNPPVNVGMM